MTTVTIVDYGIGNLLSVTHAIEKCGADAVLVSTPERLEDAGHLILPGVGAFGNCMLELKSRMLDESVIRHCDAGKPLLGICVGMQLLFGRSEEFGTYDGLGILSGSVEPIQNVDNEGTQHRVPSMGWYPLELARRPTGPKTVFADLLAGCYTYFAHSFAAVPDDPPITIATYSFADHPVTAIVGNDNVWGCQFHPEKSGKAGLDFIRSFLDAE